MVACLIVSIREAATNVSVQKVSKSIRTRFLVKVCGIPILSRAFNFGDHFGLILGLSVGSEIYALFIQIGHHDFSSRLLMKYSLNLHKNNILQILEPKYEERFKTRTIFDSRRR